MKIGGYIKLCQSVLSFHSFGTLDLALGPRPKLIKKYVIKGPDE